METCCGCFFVQKCALSRSFNYAVTISISATGFSAVQSTSNSVSSSFFSLKVLFVRISFRVFSICSFLTLPRFTTLTVSVYEPPSTYVRPKILLSYQYWTSTSAITGFLLLSQPERTPAAATARVITPALFRKLRRVILVIFLHLVNCFVSSCFPLRVSAKGG